MPSPRDRLARGIAHVLARFVRFLSPEALASVSVRISHDNSGWASISDSSLGRGRVSSVYRRL